MEKSNTQIQGSASRGKKTLRATGLDGSSMGETSARSVINSMNGDAMKDTGLNRSIRDGKVPSY